MNASTALLGRSLPALVHVQAEIPETHPSASVLGTTRMGSGTVVDSAGLVLTVSYVVLGAREVRVVFLDQSSHVAEVVRWDVVSGLALLRLPESGVPALPIGRSTDLQLGDDVFILASVGPDGARVSTGNVTYLGPYDANWEYVLDRAVMASAMNPGLGGGPLLDRRGTVVGVVSLNLNDIGRFSLAIPAECYGDARDAFASGDGQAMRTRPWLGIFCQMLNHHVVIAGLLPGGPGEQAGLRMGDVILAVDGQDVADRATLYRRLWARRPGESVTLRVHRGRTETDVTFACGDVAEFFA
ncbi:MAG: S1C family serine protease [Candidatus Binatia bacterium]